MNIKIKNQLEAWARRAEDEKNGTSHWSLMAETGGLKQQFIDAWEQPPTVAELHEAIYSLAYAFDDEDKICYCYLSLTRVDNDGYTYIYSRFGGKLLDHVLYGGKMTLNQIVEKIKSFGAIDADWGREFIKEFNNNDSNKVVINIGDTTHFYFDTVGDYRSFVDAYNINLIDDRWQYFDPSSFYAEFLDENTGRIFFRSADTPEELLELLEDDYWMDGE